VWAGKNAPLQEREEMVTFEISSVIFDRFNKSCRDFFRQFISTDIISQFA